MREKIGKEIIALGQIRGEAEVIALKETAGTSIIKLPVKVRQD